MFEILIFGWFSNCLNTNKWNNLDEKKKKKKDRVWITLRALRHLLSIGGGVCDWIRGDVFVGSAFWDGGR